MEHRIRSAVMLADTGIEFATESGVVRLLYNEIIWIYIRRQEGVRNYRYYDLTDITTNVNGDMLVINENREMYIFPEKYMRDTAGKFLVDFLMHDNTCFAGYDGMCEELYHGDFNQMKKARRIMWEAAASV